ncbi:type IX secretion system outer membrane channel protein PorV [Chitinophaga horti]|uniref:Type IX secretion system outer membrane channel protein PorV n=1 Tax=Chitinophaga horti TaxID=2920382 RepID=A0ABY6IYD3_9BACT|nr:type IX secretion system outer membrane channel protein PorV [Chitinophaga horti]UYQ92290.1 type IX secretion system outer membrane channel protein PorV [Chitinophaga horti]
MYRRIITAVACILSLSLTQKAFAQDTLSTGRLDGRMNAINTAVPFLRISPDARSGAMGDVGIAISPDANSIFWNLSKVPFASKNSAVAVTYTPWLKELVNDVFLATVSGYTKLDENSAVSGSLRYFSLGTIEFTDFTGGSLGNYRPREFAIDAGYARRLSENFGMGVALRFINSNLASGNLDGQNIRPGRAVAADVSGYYTKEYEKEDGSANNALSLGFAITNVGSRISYTRAADKKDYLPTNLGLGAAYTFGIDEYNKISLALDINKLLVPTPDTATGQYPDKDAVGAIFSSFGDASFKEELHELMYSAGAEYWYNDQFAVRAGYFSEHRTKGNRKYFTAGLGVKYDIFGLNFSYLVPSGTGIQKNPLSNTLRFTLTFDLSRDE